MGCRTTRARNQFNLWSATYDKSILQRGFFAPSHDCLMSMCEFTGPARLLDVGCGTGLFIRKLLAEHPDLTVVGLDLSDKMLEKAAENCAEFADRLELVHGDSENLPFDDESFDLVTCVHSFHHYARQQRVAEEMHRVLRPDGQVCIADANRDGWWGWFVFDCVVSTLEGGVHHCSAAEFQSLLTSAGFSDLEQVRIGRFAPVLVTHALRKPIALAAHEQPPIRKAA